MEGIVDKNELNELETFFEGRKDLPERIQLDPGTTIIDLPKFIESQISIVKSGYSLTVQRPALDRLLQLKKLLE